MNKWLDDTVDGQALGWMDLTNKNFNQNQEISKIVKSSNKKNYVNLKQ